MNVGVWGGKGSFTEEAALKYAREKDRLSIQIQYFNSIDNLLAALEQDQIEWAVFPTSNTIGGSVSETSEANAHTYTLEGEYEMDIHQCLLVFPGTKPEDVQEIFSHQQPFKQSHKYIQANYSRAVLREVNDMSVIAADIAQTKLPRTSAVIASERTAEIYNLEILAKDIQDVNPNVTKFSVVSSKKF
ncbi:hypothetical protein BH11PAT2_BH11PAT2_00970 [soil metagenome]